MLHPYLLILGYSEAAMVLRTAASPNVAAIISIHGPRDFGVDSSVAHRLDLTFDDVEVAAHDDLAALYRAVIRRRWNDQNGLTEIAPTEADVAAILEFATQIRDVDGTLLCHCAAGMSRAPAAALICLTTWRGPGSEAACVQEILHLRRGSMPHIGLVRFADKLLARNGILTAALASAIRSRS